MNEQRPPRRWRFAVVGAGSWGTALAVHCARAGHSVGLWGRDESQIAAMRRERVNQRYLPEVAFPDRLAPTSDAAAALEGADLVLSAVPSRHTRSVWNEIAADAADGVHVVSATKGIEEGTGRRMTEVLAACVPQAASVSSLSGPSFARELAEGHPTAIALGCVDSEAADRLQRALSWGPLRVYRNADLVGVEIGGALKNIIAIASGISDGLGFGSNSQAALVCRGLKEISVLATAMGGQQTTLMGLAGLGDLVLTCTGPLSRNRSLGVEIGRGRTLEEATARAQQVAEGTVTVRSAMELARKYSIEMPITEQVYGVLYGGVTPEEAIGHLLGRALVDE
jgi:glycerol-3-phosphate dehydrogenase (NAD(P)+)